MDMISNLPNEIISHIGSFLSAKEAAFTTVLSKRWRNMYTIVPKLQFDRSYDGIDGSVVDNAGMLEDFMDGILALPVTTRVKKFSLKWRVCDIKAAQYDRINLCLIHVLKLGVMELTLQVYGRERGYSLPSEVFTYKTVTKLKLGSNFHIDFLPENTYLPSLKYLSLNSIGFYEFGRCCAFNTLLSAAPVLEELVIKGIDWERWKWSFTISSPTLRRLTMKRTEWYFYFGQHPDARIRLDSRGLGHEFNSLVLDTPALTYLDYYDYVPKEYPIVSLNSLVEAKLGLRASYHRVWEKNHADEFDPMKLINAVKHVEILELDNDSMEMIYLFREAIPVFENVLRVSLHIANFCWKSLAILLKKCPKLKTLSIENRWRGGDGSVCEVCVLEKSMLSSCPLEVIKLTPYNGSSKQLKQMEYILGELSCLELVDIHSWFQDEEQRKKIEEDLLMLPKASSKCKIKAKFS